jgi:hypothetical protein
LASLITVDDEMVDAVLLFLFKAALKREKLL